MQKLNRKTLVLLSIIILVLVVLLLVFIKKPTISSTLNPQQYSENDRGMPWNIFVSFVDKGVVESLQVINSSTIRVFVKDETTPFIVSQPTQNAYNEVISKSPTQITLIE